jgi:hypothetical protein
MGHRSHMGPMGHSNHMGPRAAMPPGVQRRNTTGGRPETGVNYGTVRRHDEQSYRRYQDY